MVCRGELVDLNHNPGVLGIDLGIGIGLLISLHPGLSYHSAFPW
jgi:hypothetical protein